MRTLLSKKNLLELCEGNNNNYQATIAELERLQGKPPSLRQAQVIAEACTPSTSLAGTSPSEPTQAPQSDDSPSMATTTPPTLEMFGLGHLTKPRDMRQEPLIPLNGDNSLVAHVVPATPLMIATLREVTALSIEEDTIKLRLEAIKERIKEHKHAFTQSIVEAYPDNITDLTADDIKDKAFHIVPRSHLETLLKLHSERLITPDQFAQYDSDPKMYAQHYIAKEHSRYLLNDDKPAEGITYGNGKDFLSLMDCATVYTMEITRLLSIQEDTTLRGVLNELLATTPTVAEIEAGNIDLTPFVFATFKACSLPIINPLYRVLKPNTITPAEIDHMKNRPAELATQFTQIINGDLTQFLETYKKSGHIRSSWQSYMSNFATVPVSPLLTVDPDNNKEVAKLLRPLVEKHGARELSRLCSELLSSFSPADRARFFADATASASEDEAQANGLDTLPLWFIERLIKKLN